MKRLIPVERPLPFLETTFTLPHPSHHRDQQVPGLRQKQKSAKRETSIQNVVYLPDIRPVLFCKQICFSDNYQIVVEQNCMNKDWSCFPKANFNTISKIEASKTNVSDLKIIYFALLDFWHYNIYFKKNLTN